jgi:CxxC motif-containing protein (DUF1111 family)
MRLLSILDVASAGVMALVVVATIRSAPPQNRELDALAVQRGRVLFEGQARCSGCHSAPLPRLGRQQVQSLQAIVDRYDSDLDLKLTPEQKHELMEFLKSL